MRGRRARTELERARERLFRAASIPVVVHRNQAAHLVRVREARLEGQRPVDGRPRLWHRFAGRQDTQARVEPDVSLGQCRVGRREVGVLCDGFVEVDDRVSHRRVGPLVQGVHPLQIRVVRGNVECALPRRSVTMDSELVQDARGNLVLNREDVRELALETLRPIW